MNVRTARLATKTLAAACGVLLLLAIILYAGWGRGYRWASDADAAAAKAEPIGAIDNKPVTLPQESAFAAIDAHPLFNEDRLPTPADDADDKDAAPPPSPLNVALTGVILDDVHHVRIAMLQDKARNQPIALRVGMPLEGDQASWTLVEVKPRGVTFKSASNETTELTLETAVAQGAPAKTPPRSGSANAGRPASVSRMMRPNATADGQNNNDLAKRVEERRRQMRENAEHLRNGGRDKPPPTKPRPKQ